jgi:hypothetical protein
MSELEKGLRAIHKALLEQGKVLKEIRDLIHEDMQFEATPAAPETVDRKVAE